MVKCAKHSMCQFFVFWRTPRLQILVKTEKIGGIVFGLEFDQSLIVAAECCANCIRTFVPKKIHEAGMARERFERIRKRTGPVDMFRAFRRIYPLGFDANIKSHAPLSKPRVRTRAFAE